MISRDEKPAGNLASLIRAVYNVSIAAGIAIYSVLGTQQENYKKR